jgi:hypothetical protein
MGPGQGSEQTVAALLQSLGLGKYSIILQAEEVSNAMPHLNVLCTFQWPSRERTKSVLLVNAG